MRNPPSRGATNTDALPDASTRKTLRLRIEETKKDFVTGSYATPSGTRPFSGIVKATTAPEEMRSVRRAFIFAAAFL